MTRIVAGRARGRRLAVPPGDRTRPTSDRVREAMFSALDNELGGFAGIVVLDLYAGSGALGLEALSRGARMVVLVESDGRAARTIAANLDAVGLPGGRLIARPVERFVRDAGKLGVPADLSTDLSTDLSVDLVADLVLADPPYDLIAADLADLLGGLVDTGRLSPSAVVVVERRSGAEFGWPAGLVGLRERRYGDTTLWYGRRVGAADRPLTPPGTREDERG